MRTRASPGQGPTPNFSRDLLTLCGDILKERHLVPHFLHKVKCLCEGDSTPEWPG